MAVGCAAQDSDVITTQTEQAVEGSEIGSPFPGTDEEEFEDALEDFAAVEDIDKGLGPARWARVRLGRLRELPRRSAVRDPGAAVQRRAGNFAFFPFSDFLVHDMGGLGDGIGNTGDPVAVTRRMRTSPLWGAALSTGQQNLLLRFVSSL